MLRFSQCRCGTRYFSRVPRKWWMKLFWTRGLYICASCNRSHFLPAKRVDAEIRSFRGEEAAAMRR